MRSAPQNRRLPVNRTLLPILLLVSACGPVRYIPIEMLGPRPIEDPGLRMSAVEAELRIGEQWLEVRLHNPGPAPVRIDWGRASFTEPTGTAHFLLSSARLSQIFRYSSMSQSSVHDEHGAFMLGPIAPGDAWAEQAWTEHRVPSVLRRETREIAIVLEAGESIREVLYPSEHLRVGEGGALSFGSLFCGGDAGVGSQETFTVRIPVHTEDQWEMVMLVARLR
jgi:hypothetical protein